MRPIDPEHCWFPVETVVSGEPGRTLAWDEGRARTEGAARVLVTLASCSKGGGLERAAGAVVLPLTRLRVAQSCRPTLADIIGARREWTVAMISSVSMPCR